MHHLWNCTLPQTNVTFIQNVHRCYLQVAVWKACKSYLTHNQQEQESETATDGYYDDDITHYVHVYVKINVIWTELCCVHCSGYVYTQPIYCSAILRGFQQFWRPYWIWKLKLMVNCINQTHLIDASTLYTWVRPEPKYMSSTNSYSNVHILMIFDRF